MSTIKSVVISGASSGIGRATALKLAQEGWQVFAGVRKSEDGATLPQASNQIIPILLDITNDQQIKAALKEVTQKLAGRGLAGLVNNAGVAVASPLEFISLADFRYQLEVNLTGQLALTQAFLPLLRLGAGRIINISSVGGFSASPIIGAYNAAKFGLEAVSDTLRLELAKAKVKVVVIQPGSIATPIWDKWDKSRDATLAKLPDEANSLYGELTQAMDSFASFSARTGLPPAKVAEVITKALSVRQPKTRYLVGGDAKMLAALKILPDGWRDRLITNFLRRTLKAESANSTKGGKNYG